MSQEAAKAEVIKLYSQGRGRRWICQTLRLTRAFVYAVIADYEGRTKRDLPFEWLPADDEANLMGSESNYLPTPDEIRRECLKIRAKNGHLRPEEIEEMRA